MHVRPACAAPAASRLVAAAVLLGAAASPRVCLAQRSASLQAGASWVRYDGFLGAGAGFLTGALAWRDARTSLGIRGTALAFETGHTSLQAAAAADALDLPLGPLRADLGADAGASTYMDVSRFAHVLVTGRLRWPVVPGAADVWIGPSAGQVFWDGGGAGATGGAAGASLALPSGMIVVGLTHMSVRAARWNDATAQLRLASGAVTLAATGGLRFGSGALGDGGYGDAAATWRLGRGVALVLAGGRYPSDPVRGAIPGSYVTLGFQLARRPAPRVATTAASLAASPRALPDSGEASAALEMHAVGGAWILTITSAAARRVEIMGDFTAWNPVPLDSAGPGTFTYRARLASGVYRFDIRLDGGAWVAPAGAATAPDDFGSVAAVIVVP